MTFDWKSLVGTVAPTIATALGGPLAGLAVSAVSEAVLGRPDASERELATALRTASPETLLKIKEAELAFETRLAELGIDLEKIHQQDRASARDREAKTGDTWTPRILALGITAGFFATLGRMLIVGVPPGHEALYIMLGSLGTAWAGVTAYYFGSSVGSKEKTAHMAVMRK